MANFFKSQEMGLYYLLAPREGIYRLMSGLGELGLFHFLDADPHVPQLQRLYFKQIRRCDDLLRQIDEIKQIMDLFKYQHGIEQSDPAVFLNLLQLKHKTRRSQEEHYIDQLEAEIPIALRDIQVQNKSSQDIRRNMNKQIEEILSLEDVGPAFFESMNSREIAEQSGGERAVHIRRVLGSLNTVDSLRFQKSVFRASKGNCLMIIKQLEYKNRDRIIDPTNPKEEMAKSYFLIVFSSSASNYLQNRISRICEAFNADLFSINEDLEQGASVEQLITSRVEELAKNRELLALTYRQLDRCFQALQASTDNITKLEQLRLTLIREKAIYQHINLMKNTGAVLKALVWLPKSAEDKVLSYLQETQDQKSATAQLYPVPESEYHLLDPVRKQQYYWGLHYLLPIIIIVFIFICEFPKEMKIPTKISTNEFTAVFQEIVDTYGIPRYGEINPGFFTVITFPFLFGVMFGDIGHGLLLFSLGIYLMASNSNNTQSQLYRCRYLITLMGLFASYCGFIYNDFMSVPLSIAGNCYQVNKNNQVSMITKDCVVPFGIDTAWLTASNSLTFYNSFKMKTAIILGISQMTLGVILKGINAIIQSNPVDFFFEFVPQIAFLMSTFGYLVLMIVLKWLTVFEPGKSPSILTAMLNFPLKLGQVDENQPHLLDILGYSAKEQQELQILLLIIAIISVPLMLLPKPFILALSGSQRKENGFEELRESQSASSMDMERDNTTQNHRKHHPQSANQHHQHDLSEVLVHQMIESIEFVLGSISHTASYLRLWALSLAHSQLSAVFFEKTLLSSIEDASIIGIMLGFFVFATISFAVLMCMDVMECFLHTLRLHWVEFQSKFYKADGILFQPLDFKAYLSSTKN